MRFCVLLFLAGLTLSSKTQMHPDMLAQISSLTQNALAYGTYHWWHQGTDVIVKFESDDRIGLAWLEAHDSKYYYNYIRIDTTGTMISDLRNFAEKEDYSSHYGLDWELSIPHLNYFLDVEGATWIVYTYIDPNGWHVAWLRVDADGNILRHTTLPKSKADRYFIGCNSRHRGFHIILMPDKRRYFNPLLDSTISLNDQYDMRPIPKAPRCCIEIDAKTILLLGYNPYSSYYHRQFISSEGMISRIDSVSVDSVSSVIWRDVNVPDFCEIFRSDTLIVSIHSQGGDIRKIVFRANGEIMRSQMKEGKIMSIDQIPSDARKLIKIRNGTYYFLGFDNTNQLYFGHSVVKKEN